MIWEKKTPERGVHPLWLLFSYTPAADSERGGYEAER